MARLYGWTAVALPFVGMACSMISHRYAYMNGSFGMAIFFALTALAMSGKNKQ